MGDLSPINCVILDLTSGCPWSVQLYNVIRDHVHDSLAANGSPRGTFWLPPNSSRIGHEREAIW